MEFEGQPKVDFVVFRPLRQPLLIVYYQLCSDEFLKKRYGSWPTVVFHLANILSF